MLNGPVAVLVDSRSMSASEMFARHLQLAGRATVIGDQTLGRVNAAHIISLSIGVDRLLPYGVEVSVGRVIFPGGEELEGKGVTPDSLCIPSSEDLHARRDTCLLLALQSVRKALSLPEEAELKVEKKEEAPKP